MMRELTHDEARELMALDALDALPPEDRDALAQHLASCAECAREATAMRDAAGAMAYAAPESALDASQRARLRSRLVARATADRAASAGAADVGEVHTTPSSTTPLSTTPQREPIVVPMRPHQRGGPPQVSTVRMLAAAALIIVVAGVGAWALAERQTNERLRAQVESGHEYARSLEQQVAERDSTIAATLGADVKVITARSNPNAPWGQMFWDQPANRWTFVAHNLPSPRAGRTYQLWLVTTDQRKVSAGTFQPRADGDALVRATYALPRTALAAIAVTEEPAGGSPQPTTTPFIVGRAE